MERAVLQLRDLVAKITQCYFCHSQCRHLKKKSQIPRGASQSCCRGTYWMAYTALASFRKYNLPHTCSSLCQIQFFFLFFVFFSVPSYFPRVCSMFQPMTPASVQYPLCFPVLFIALFNVRFILPTFSDLPPSLPSLFLPIQASWYGSATDCSDYISVFVNIPQPSTCLPCRLCSSSEVSSSQSTFMGVKPHWVLQ